MHILIFTDQHIDSLGGAQVSIRLQRKYLERAGHRVTVVAPRQFRRPAARSDAEPNVSGDIDLPAAPITRDREYGAVWPGARARRFIRTRLRDLPTVDVVHVQGDFWGALLGYAMARELDVPVVHTMHNNLDVGTRSVTVFADAVFFALRALRRILLGSVDRRSVPGKRRHRSSGAWRYLGDLAREAAHVVAPSAHFARELEREGVATAIAIVPTGVDDDVLDELLDLPRVVPSPPRFVFLGRMSPEKRPVELVDAFARVTGVAELELVGAGLLLERVRQRIHDLGIDDRVTIRGPLPYGEALAAIRRASALVQTSVGFETQGMTPFEAAALGTPTVYADVNIMREVNAEPAWLAEAATVESLAEALERALTDLRTTRGDLRVTESEGTRLRQSYRTQQLLDLYADARKRGRG